MPGGLISATKDHLEGRISRDMLFRRLVERKRYLGKANGKPNANGAVQYIHPTERGRHVCNPERKGAQKFCKQRTVLVPRSKLDLKYRQKFSYLSAEWARLHYAGRSSIEGFNGQLKNRKKAAADEPARVPVRGYAVKYLATAMAVITTNTDIVKRFDERTEETLAGEAKARAKRREGASAEVYHDPQFWIDLTLEEAGRDLLEPEEEEDEQVEVE
ncbi:hypothetical protein ACHAAC_14790 [Aeromicrobium sp. CF4.19]|uniref:hypothetical protein n=1 Tax=Aeromicrobium sp. CF4.19 TaxID=3373082 RepID=UPI003EE7F822